MDIYVQRLDWDGVPPKKIVRGHPLRRWLQADAPAPLRPRRSRAGPAQRRGPAMALSTLRTEEHTQCPRSPAGRCGKSSGKRRATRSALLLFEPGPTSGLRTDLQRASLSDAAWRECAHRGSLAFLPRASGRAGRPRRLGTGAHRLFHRISLSVVAPLATGRVHAAHSSVARARTAGVSRRRDHPPLRRGRSTRRIPDARATRLARIGIVVGRDRPTGKIRPQQTAVHPGYDLAGPSARHAKSIRIPQTACSRRH